MSCENKEDRIRAVVNCVTVLALLAVVVPIAWMSVSEVTTESESQDAYILTKTVDTGTVRALWQYKQLKMNKCAWCARTVNMNRHHVIPQAANPALRDVKENLVVLCRDCHFVLGHRCNWKQYNPDVLYICTHYTNCVRSIETRRGLEPVEYVPESDFSDILHTNASAPAIPATDVQKILHVTNDVPERQRAALERILTWKQPQSLTNTLPVRRSPGL